MFVCVCVHSVHANEGILHGSSLKLCSKSHNSVLNTKYFECMSAQSAFKLRSMWKSSVLLAHSKWYKNWVWNNWHFTTSTDTKSVTSQLWKWQQGITAKGFLHHRPGDCECCSIVQVQVIHVFAPRTTMHMYCCQKASVSNFCWICNDLVPLGC